jgi:hypothetical protein
VILRWSLAALLTFAGVLPAYAHSSARGFVMLLPTGYVILGGAFAVLVTFVAVSFLPERHFLLQHNKLLENPARTGGTGQALSLLSALTLGFLIYTGFNGPRDPAENLLPLGIWTLWWVVIVLLHPVFGNLWSALNPFAGIQALLRRLTGDPHRIQSRYPPALSYWPALLTFASFAWFQLVYPAPEDPALLATVVSIYLAFTLAAVLICGAEAWLGKGDPFAVFLAQLGACAPVDAQGRLRLPGSGLLHLRAMPASGVLFVLLTLSAISFDGFASTFLWLSAVGINPLDYPGRTALMGVNTLGLAGSFLAMVSAYVLCIALGWQWSGRSIDFQLLLGRMVFSLIPISIAYHFAHYLSGTLINLQYFALALNDPAGTGANLLGLAGYHVTASFQNTASGALIIFTAQTAVIILGHSLAVAVAHAIAAECHLPRPATLKLETPLVVLMVIYTGFGLWLLATPSIA